MSIGKVVSISFLIVTISLYSLVLVRTAWICDDALITYRVVYNFINGYGLRWNTAERVQVYTHPLWMFLNAGVYFLTNEVYYTLIFTGIAVSVISVALYGFFIPSFPVAGILGILILIFSRSFMDFSAAGLENPMTHLLLVLFFIIYFRIVGAQHAVPRASTTRPYTIFKAFCSENHESQHFSNVKPDGKKLFLLGLIAAFAITNRMDTILIYIPAMIYLLSKFRPLKRGIYLIAVSSTPFILWELFSLFYYGFLFPNTAYAKLNTGVSGILLMKHGFRYFVETFKYDPITLTVILISFVVPFLLRKRGYLPLSIGILFYLVYIIKIGGDYMAGRYFTAPIFLSAIILTQSAFKSFNKSFYIMLLSVLFLGFVTPYPTVFTGENFGWDKTTRNMIGSVTDNRRIFYKYSGLLTVLNGRREKLYQNMIFKYLPSYTITGAIGDHGFKVGPHVYIIDRMGLADPLLSRLGTINKDDFWIGHFKRQIPTGYLESLKTGKNVIRNKNIALFYDKIVLLTRGDIFDKDRLETIWNMNIGKYDNLLKDLVKPFPIPLKDVFVPNPKPPPIFQEQSGDSKKGILKPE